MSVNNTICLLFLIITCSASADITFKNVSFRVFNMYTEKDKIVIDSSNNLKDVLPKIVFDKVEFQNQTMPVIYEGALADLKYLDELVIQNCEVYEIRPGALKNVPLLRRLSLKGNKLEEIKNDVFNNLPVSVLDLSYNHIQKIEDNAFNNMANLIHINLENNKLQTWNPNWFHNTPLLSRVNMMYNLFETLPDQAFKNLVGDKTRGSLNISLHLVFSYNKIKNIDAKALRGLTSIRNLWLDHNNLESFDEELLNNITIKDLRIDHNNIKCLEGDYEKIFKAESTHIDNNPLKCDCLKSMKSYVKKTSKEVDFFNADMNCFAEKLKEEMDSIKKRLKEMSMIGKRVEDVDIKK